MTLEDWEAPPLAHVPGVSVHAGREMQLTAGEWLNLQHKRGFPKNPG